jgi:uncharacterized protein
MRWLRAAFARFSSVDKPVEAVDNLQGTRFKGQRVLGIMAKEPRAGSVKTRLCPPLTPEEAAALYSVSLGETVARMRRGGWQTVIFYAGARRYFDEQFPGVHLVQQHGSDLGERMANALGGLLAAGARSAVLIGSDSPDLPLAHLDQAFERLEQCPAVVAPAADGGYILIGESHHCPELFSEIAWSSAQVLRQTRLRAAAVAIRLGEVAPWEDLDDTAALQRLLQRSPTTPTARFIQTQLAHHGLFHSGG